MKIIKINFGISSCSRYAPGVPWEERIMEIPGAGELPKPINWRYLDADKAKPRMSNVLNYSSVRYDEYTKLPAVYFRLSSGLFDDIYKMYLIWLEQRCEWIAVHHHEWSAEDSRMDESELGPYSLDDYCRDMLVRAHKVNKEKVPGDISKMSPSEINSLEKVLTLYLYDHKDVDGTERFLDVVITTSQEEAYEKAEIRLESVVLSKEEIKELTDLNREDIMRKLFSKLGITNLKSYPGLPKGPYYRVDESVYIAVGKKDLSGKK
ncbi:hypothetical protein HZC30_06000 [Candidatus Woesearchaeota archaeon]|nr:hypothetical protein [Candidatus Woesearchaeota archaeon]